MINPRLFAAASLSALITAFSAAMAQTPHGPVEPEASDLSPDLRINHLQVLGTHNSYEKPVDRRVLNLVAPVISKMMTGFTTRMTPEQQALLKEEHPNGLDFNEALNYDHPPLIEQLNLGVRSLEIDINADPEGGHYLNPVSYKILHNQGVVDLPDYDTTDMDRPGFKVFHIADIDFRSHCPTLRICLYQVRDWSDSHPGHLPLFLLIEAKVQDIPILPGATRSVPFTPEIFDALDKEFVAVMGRERIITPDDVRGDYPTLNAAIKAGNWPKLKDSRGKVLFLILTANGPDGADMYLKNHEGLKGRLAFLRSEPGQDYGAFLLEDNALVRHDQIQNWVKEGYLVRTRSDIETYEAKVNDMTRANAAFDSGAQIISTDFEKHGNAYGTNYMVTLPEGKVARCSPVVTTCSLRK